MSTVLRVTEASQEVCDKPGLVQPGSLGHRSTPYIHTFKIIHQQHVVNQTSTNVTRAQLALPGSQVEGDKGNRECYTTTKQTLTILIQTCHMCVCALVQENFNHVHLYDVMNTV